MSDFIREVDEDYRRDKVADFWKTHGWKLLLLAGIILMGFAGYSYWENAKAKNLEAQARDYLTIEQLIEQGQSDDALAALQTFQAQELSPGYRGLAQMRSAQLLLEDGRRDKAILAYATLAGDTLVPTSLRDLGRLTEVSLRMNQMTADEVIAALSSMTLTSDYRHSAGELIGSALLAEGHNEEAIPYFRQVMADETAPSTLRSRAQTLLTALDAPEVLPMAEAPPIEPEALEAVTPEAAE